MIVVSLIFFFAFGSAMSCFDRFFFVVALTFISFLSGLFLKASISLPRACKALEDFHTAIKACPTRVMETGSGPREDLEGLDASHIRTWRPEAVVSVRDASGRTTRM